MNTRDFWFLFSKYVGTTVFHPQFIINRLQKETIIETKKYAKGKLVDIGCGRMPYRKEIEPQIESYTGVDHPEVSKLYKNSEYAPEVLADAKNLPFEDNTFDTALLLQVLEHVDFPDKVIKEAARVLKPDGILVISLPFLYPLHDMPYDWGRYTHTALRNFVNKASLKIVMLKAQGGFFEFWLQSLNTYLMKRIYDILSSKKNVVSVIYLFFLVAMAPITIVTVNIIVIFILFFCRILPSYPDYFPLSYIAVGKKIRRT